MNPRLALFSPPYLAFESIDTSWTSTEVPVGTAMVWRPHPDDLNREFDFVDSRPRGYSLVIILPPPGEIAPIASALPRLGLLRPYAVLPAIGVLDQPPVVRTALSIPPYALPELVSWYLDRHRIVTNSQARQEIRRIFELAPKLGTVTRLCREMYTSRRTLGRHFEAENLPVPSHWLQFARVLNVVLKSHAERTAIFRLATAAGYPDGFSLSNQMKRLIGYRPSEIRGLYGFEWLVEQWLVREKVRVV